MAEVDQKTDLVFGRSEVTDQLGFVKPSKCRESLDLNQDLFLHHEIGKAKANLSATVLDRYDLLRFKPEFQSLLVDI